ncbi:MAG: biopolymer transporter ExbD [Bacteriovoracales bacterium]|nr:biopolymer transporter ExbD [Bacteriovoracales bacterium]
MLRSPSGRRTRNQHGEKLNLIPILDSVFIFIFFLLMSASFLNLFEISSDAPIISSAPPPKNKKPPLALTITIQKNKILVSTGIPSQVRRSFDKMGDGQYDLLTLKEYLISLKKRNTREETAILEPKIDLDYETLVKIMDTIRTLRDTDEDIFYKDENGIDRKADSLFAKIIFGNILS